MVQLNFNWTVGETLLVSDESQFDNTGQFYVKDDEIFYHA